MTIHQTLTRYVGHRFVFGVNFQIIVSRSRPIMSYPLDTKEGELYILPITLTELQQTSQWKCEVSSNKLLHALMELAWLCLNLAFALIPRLIHHLLLHICVTAWLHSLLWKINTKCYLKICRAGEGPLAQRKTEIWSILYFLILSRDSDL